MRTRTPIDDLVQYGPLLSATARRMSPTAADAEDLVQDTWLHLLRWCPDVVRDPRKFLPCVARRVRASRLEREYRRHSTVRTIETVDNEIEPTEECPWTYLLRLPPVQRAAIEMRVLGDLRPREIARREGVPVETVRTRIRRGLATLRRELHGRAELAGRGESAFVQER